MYPTFVIIGVFGLTGTIILMLYNAIFGEKIKMSQRMDSMMGEKDIPIRKQELSAPLYQRMFRPMLGKSANLLLMVVPFSREDVLDKKVREAGRPGNLNAREWMVVKALMALGLTTLFWLVLRRVDKPVWQMVMMLLPVFFLGWFSIDVWLSGKGRQRREEVEASMPDLLDLLTVSVEAGLGFEGAIMKIVEKTQGLLSNEFLTVLREIKMGKARRDAMKNMAARLNVDALSNFVSSIVLAEQLGISIGNVLRVQSKEIRQKKRQKIEEKAMKAPIKMLIPMVLFIFPVIFIVLLGPAMLQIMRAF